MRPLDCIEPEAQLSPYLDQDHCSDVCFTVQKANVGPALVVCPSSELGEFNISVLHSIPPCSLCSQWKRRRGLFLPLHIVRGSFLFYTDD